MEKQQQTEYHLETAKELQNTYAALIDGLTHPDDETKHWSKIDEVWNNYPEFQLNQGDITGNFRRESVEYYLGSLPGYSIKVNVETDSGDQDIQLYLNNKIPSFTIKPVIDLEPINTIKPIHEDIAQFPINEAFDWSKILNDAALQEHLNSSKGLYLVVFRSKLKNSADLNLLLDHDEKAYESAKKSPALIHYYGGSPDNNGNALSFCLWFDRESAKKVSQDSNHINATMMVNHYESYSLEKYNVQSKKSEIVFEPLN